MIINIERVPQEAAAVVDPMIEALNIGLVRAGPKGLKGDTGNKGWTPVLAVANDNARRVQQVIDWVGGEGTKPGVGDYIGAAGLEEDIADGVDIRGGAGAAATIAVQSTTTLPPGSSATVTNAGSSSAAQLVFGIPKGDPGEDGEDGDAATVVVGTVTTLPAGSSATVVNSGTASAAVLDFGIPQGDPGEDGEDGAGAGDVIGPAGATDGNIAVFDLATGKKIKDGGTPAAVIAAAGHAATAKTTPVDADEVSFYDSAASWVLKKVSWVDVKATLKSFFDGLYQPVAAKLTTLAGQTWAADRYTYYTSASAAAIGTITSFGRTFIAHADAATAFSNIKQAATDTATGVVEKATANEVRAATADKYISADLIPLSCARVALTDASTVAIDWSAIEVAEIAMAGNRTIGNPTNVQVDTTRYLIIRSSSGTSRTPAYGSNFKGVPSDSVTNTSVLILALYAYSATQIIVTSKLVSI